MSFTFLNKTDFGYGPVAEFANSIGEIVRLDIPNLRLRIDNLKKGGWKLYDEEYALSVLIHAAEHVPK